MIRGIGGFEGIAIGKVFVKRDVEMNITHHKVEEPDQEIERFNVAAEKCRIELERSYKKTLNILGEDEAESYKRHLNVFNGSILLGQVRKEIQEQGNNAEYILHEVMKKYASMFDKVADEFLKKKSESIKYIAELIIKELIGVDQSGIMAIKEPVILVASDLDQNDVVNLEKGMILGVVIENPNKASAAVTMAASFEIPCVIAAKGLLSAVQGEDTLIIDGGKGEVLLNPDEETMALYMRKVNKEKELETVYQLFASLETETEDGYHYDLASRCVNVNDVYLGKTLGQEGVGLFCTDYLFVGRQSAPSETVQLSAYRDAVVAAEGKDIQFRVMDVFSDSTLPYLYLPAERNPLLGYRSIRLLSKEREMFLAQIRAILQASAYGSSKLVIPFITSMDELIEVKMAIEEAKVQLDEKGVLYDPDLQVGLVLATPVACLTADLFAREVDFIIIGTTDLCQLMLGCDRNNDMVSELYDCYNPGILRLIRQTIQLAHKEGTRVGISGDLVRQEYLVPLLIAFGIDQIVAEAHMITKLRWATSKVNRQKWENDIEGILGLESGSEVKQYLEKRYYEEVLWR